MDDLSRFCCQDPDCPAYGRRRAGNLSVCDRYGKQNHIRLLCCSACKARFSERKGTPLFDCRMPEEKARSVLHHLAEDNGIRQTGRLVGVHRDTVVRLARTAGDHAHDAHDEFVAFSPSDQRGPTRRGLVVRREEAEELRPGRSGRRPQEGLVGPCRLRRRAQAGVGGGPRGRVGECAQEVVEEVKDRLGDRPPALFTSDEHAAYETAIVTAFSEAEPAPEGPQRPGRPRVSPRRRPAARLAYATVRKERKEGRVASIRRTVVLGDERAVEEVLKASV